MAGLLSNIEPDRAPSARDDVVADDDTPNVSPEEQATYERLVDQAFKLMYEGGEVRPFILQLLDNDPDDLREIFGDALPLDEPDPDGSGKTMWEAQGPIIALAATTCVVAMEAVRRSDIDPEEDGYIILHAGAQILEDIAEISEKSGKHNFTQDEVNEAMRKAADLYRAAGSEEGLVNLDRAKQEFNEIVAADKEGRIGDILPQLAGNAQ